LNLLFSLQITPSNQQ